MILTTSVIRTITAEARGSKMANAPAIVVIIEAKKKPKSGEIRYSDVLRQGLRNQRSKVKTVLLVMTVSRVFCMDLRYFDGKYFNQMIYEL
jgi:hypothetical protein